VRQMAVLKGLQVWQFSMLHVVLGLQVPLSNRM
jgi:hypothetical protein